MDKPLLGLALFPALVVLTLVVGLSCGSNPPFAPFGSAVTILDPLGNVTIPPETIAITQRIQAQVLDPDGLPLNDVRVRFSLSFASNLDDVVDTDGDGIGDAAALQLVDPDLCEKVFSVPCDQVQNRLQLFQAAATVTSPHTKLTDNRGIADVFILISGDVVVDPATFEASTDSGSVDTFDFSVNAQ